MSTELARWTCPRCKLTRDVWLENGTVVVAEALCPNCRADGIEVLCRPDPAATALYDEES